MIMDSSVTLYTSRCSSLLRRDQYPCSAYFSGSGLSSPENGWCSVSQDEMHNTLKHFAIYSCPLNKILESASFKDNVPHRGSSKGIVTRLRSWATFSMARNKRSLFAWDFNKYAVSSSSVCAASHTLISISLSLNIAFNALRKRPSSSSAFILYVMYICGSPYVCLGNGQRIEVSHAVAPGLVLQAASGVTHWCFLWRHEPYRQEAAQRGWFRHRQSTPIVYVHRSDGPYES